MANLRSCKLPKTQEGHGGRNISPNGCHTMSPADPARGWIPVVGSVTKGTIQVLHKAGDWLSQAHKRIRSASGGWMYNCATAEGYGFISFMFLGWFGHVST